MSGRMSPEEILDFERAIRLGDIKSDPLWSAEFDLMLIHGLVRFQLEHQDILETVLSKWAMSRTEFVSHYIYRWSGQLRSGRQIIARLRVLRAGSHVPLSSLIRQEEPIQSLLLPTWMLRYQNPPGELPALTPIGRVRIDKLQSVTYTCEEEGQIDIGDEGVLPPRLHASIVNSDTPAHMILCTPFLLTGYQRLQAVPVGTTDFNNSECQFAVDIELLAKSDIFRGRYVYAMDVLATDEAASSGLRWSLTHEIRGRVEQFPDVTVEVHLRYEVQTMPFQQAVAPPITYPDPLFRMNPVELPFATSFRPPISSLSRKRKRRAVAPPAMLNTYKLQPSIPDTLSSPFDASLNSAIDNPSACNINAAGSQTVFIHQSGTEDASLAFSPE
uniref:Uncharacterized protein n=1 Tax=Mycena chlorophos TaxID=658473 RepID=A0ABQ0L9N6_MYCCL|nr:predicted protein [Mycena chlorophos]